MSNVPTELIQQLTQEVFLALTEKFQSQDNTTQLINVIENQMQAWKGIESLFFEVQFLHSLRNALYSDTPDIEEENPYYAIFWKLTSDIDAWWDDFTSKNPPPYFSNS